MGKKTKANEKAVELPQVPTPGPELITPERADELLQNNTRNRPLSTARSRILAQLIANGEWAINGETIKVASTGRLLDGQHRLAAIRASGIACYCHVVYGLDEDVFHTIDVGGKRTPGHTLSTLGVKQSAATAAALAIVGACIDQRVTFAAVPRVTNSEIIDLWEEHQDISHCMHWLTRLKPVCSYVTLPPAMFYLFAKVDPALAQRFMQDLETGAMLRAGDPVLGLRDALMKDRANKSYIIPRGEMVALFIKAWNLRQSGRTTRNTLTIRTRGNTPEHFPAIMGFKYPDAADESEGSEGSDEGSEEDAA